MTDSLPSTAPLAEAAPTTGIVERALPGSREHWRAHVDPDGVQWWLLDRAGSGTNSLSEGVLAELEHLVGAAERSRPRGIVIRSLKDSGFIAGAEIGEFRDIDDSDTVRERLLGGHRLLERLESIEAPSIALVHGFCLGGGLELALACRHIIARSDSSFGFPEIRLGLHPGLGGTVRLPRRIGPAEALKWMLTGKTADSHKARRLGLVDAVTEERHFGNAVSHAIDGKLPRSQRSLTRKLMNTKPARQIIARQSLAKTGDKVAPEHYPAPFALISAWRDHGGSRRDMARAERESFAELLTGDTARNLVRVFFLREILKTTDSDVDAGVRRVHVVGAGTMGGDIAAWCARHGFHVTLADQSAEQIAPAMRRANRLYQREFDSMSVRRDALDRLMPDPDGSGLRNADLVIEAVPEKLQLKRKIFADIEKHAPADAILATNTSSIPLEKLADACDRPDRLIGLHFFNPVARMQVVEVVTHGELDDDVGKRSRAFTAALDRLPVTVASAPGFLVNRVLMPYLLEALALLDDGRSKEVIDAAAKAFGMPMGPIELADQVGLDVALEVADYLHDALDQPMYPVPDWLRSKVDDGHLGRKTGKGLYDYGGDGNPKISSDGDRPSAKLTDRLLLPYLDTAVRCLDENIVDDADRLDAAMIFATGFAPFRGGPLEYARKRGADNIIEAMQELESDHGERFSPSPYWREIFDDNTRQ